MACLISLEQEPVRAVRTGPGSLAPQNAPSKRYVTDCTATATPQCASDECVVFFIEPLLKETPTPIDLLPSLGIQNSNGETVLGKGQRHGAKETV